MAIGRFGYKDIDKNLENGRNMMLNENTPILKTKRLILRKLTDSVADMEAMFAILRDEEVNTYLPWYPVKTMAEVQAHVKERFFDAYARPSAYKYVICLKEDNIPIGYIRLHNNPAQDFGYGLRSEFWHQGIVSEAAKAVLERIRLAGYDFITATYDVENTHSSGVMKKLGMNYCYSYVEQWMPKNRRVTFRMYQLNFDGNSDRVYQEYWEKYPEHFVEENV